MKRRQALQRIAVISATAAILPACDFAPVPVLDNIPLERNQWRSLEWLANQVLPMEDLEVSTPETRTDFVLRMVNDCYEPEDIERFVAGLQGFEQYLQDKFERTYKRLDEIQAAELLAELQAGGSAPKEIQYFYDTTRGLTQRHFTSSEYFLTNYLDYEFAPGRYLGCVPVEG